MRTKLKLPVSLEVMRLSVDDDVLVLRSSCSGLPHLNDSGLFA